MTAVNWVDEPNVVVAGVPSTVVALVSGRSRDVLESWFGHIANIWLAAEHGAIVRPPNGAEWEQHHNDYSIEWKNLVYPMLEHYVDRTPGSFIEEKEYSLVWHHRMSDPEFGEWLAKELVANLDQMLADTQLRAVRGQKSVEVKLIWANKGEVYARMMRNNAVPDFLLAAGDDATDEDLFARLPDEAWTIHIGRNQSRARYRLVDCFELKRLLNDFVAVSDVASRSLVNAGSAI